MSKKRKGGPVDAIQVLKRVRTEPMNLQNVSVDQATNACPKSTTYSEDLPPIALEDQEQTTNNSSVSSAEAGPSKIASATPQQLPSTNKSKDNAQRRKMNTLPSGYSMRKLAPQRPFPVVPASVSATGPRSAHREGKNLICVTRKTPLGQYLRRCKEVIMKDGYVVSFVLLFLSL